MKEQKLEVKFSLPETVKFCRKCVINNQKPTTSIEYKNIDGKREFIDFDDEGVCSACRFNMKKKNIDWQQREKKLEELLARYRRTDGAYDVVVPVSGGKDSSYTAHVLKYRYGMNPLTVTWSPHIYTKVGWDNIQSMINTGGFDNILFSPNGKVHRLLTKLAFQNLLHPFQPFVFGQKNIGPRVSILYDIPLVMYGESNVEYGDVDDQDDEEMSEGFFSGESSLDDIYLGGVAVAELIAKNMLTINDLDPYLPVDPARLKETGSKVHYLGHYLKWDPQECYYYAVENTGLRAADERSEGTYSKYTEIDDKLIPLHFYCMYIKFGIGRATYDAAQEIRNDKISREEGVALVRKFDGEYPQRYLNELLQYMGISREELDNTVDRFRSPHLWKKGNGEWKLRQPIE